MKPASKLLLLLLACLIAGGAWLLGAHEAREVEPPGVVLPTEQAVGPRGTAVALTPVEELLEQETREKKKEQRVALDPAVEENQAPATASDLAEGATWRLVLIDALSGEELRLGAQFTLQGDSFRASRGHSSGYTAEQLDALPAWLLGRAVDIEVAGYANARLVTMDSDRDVELRLFRERRLKLRFTSSNDPFERPRLGPLDFQVLSDQGEMFAERVHSLPGAKSFSLGSERKVWVRVAMPTNVGGTLPIFEVERELEDEGDTVLAIDLSAMRRSATADIRLHLSFADADYDVRGTLSEVYACNALGERIVGAKGNLIDLYSWRIGEVKGEYELLCRDLPRGSYTLRLTPIELEHTFQVLPPAKERMVRVPIPSLHRITVSPRNAKEELLVPQDCGEIFWGDLDETGSRELFESLARGGTRGIDQAVRTGLLRELLPGSKRWHLATLPGRNLWIHLRGEGDYISQTFALERTGGVSDLDWKMQKAQ